MASKKKNTEEIKEVVEPVNTEVTETLVESKGTKQSVKQETKNGKIKDCELLNVRKKPDIESDKLGVFSKDSKFEIFPSDLDSEWTKVITDTGYRGYVLSRFVTVK